MNNISIGNDNPVINTGVEKQPPPPSSPEIRSSETGQSSPAAEVELSKQAVGESNKKDENITKEKVTDKSLEEELKESIKSLNDKLGRMDREVQFKMDKKIDRHYISVIDKGSKEIIREFPPEEIRNFIAKFDELNEKLSASQDVKSMIVNLEA